MTEIHLAIFDLAGATIADEGHVLSASQAALLAHAIPITNPMLQPWRGTASAKHCVSSLSKSTDAMRKATPHGLQR